MHFNEDGDDLTMLSAKDQIIIATWWWITKHCL